MKKKQGQVVSSVDEAEHAYVNVLNKGDAVVKAQVCMYASVYMWKQEMDDFVLFLGRRCTS